MQLTGDISGLIAEKSRLEATVELMTGTDEEIAQKRDEDEKSWIAERRRLGDELASNTKSMDDLKLRIDSLEKDILSEREANGVLESKVEVEASRATALEKDLIRVKSHHENELNRLKSFVELKMRESMEEKRKSLERIEGSERALADADTTAELEAARADKLEKEVIALKKENSEERRRS